ncbi:MAG TPA: hypothetical protein VKF41_04100 [Bryobacteraceae bacterium]|nr:hypothetical protein [Bryobacteraceae bacterium]
MIARLPWSVRTGLALILGGAACFGGWIWWDATRIWVPLDVPISLSPGHIRTPEFKINLEAKYWIELEMEQGCDFEDRACLGGYWRRSPLSIPWTLSSAGRAVPGDGESPFRSDLGCFNAGAGRYVLDLDVLQDGSRFNRGKPRLVVFASGYQRQGTNQTGTRVFLLSLFMAVAGLYLIGRWALERRREKLAALTRSWSLTQPGPQPRSLPTDLVPAAVETNFQPAASARVGTVLILAGLAAYAAVWYWIAPSAGEYAPFDDCGFYFSWLCLTCVGAGAVLVAMGRFERHREPPPPVAPCLGEGIARGHIRWKPGPAVARPFSGLSYFGLVAAIFYMLLVLVRLVADSLALVPKGLEVHLLRLGVTAPRNPGIQPVLVRVNPRKTGGGASLSVNGRPVEWDGLAAVLQKELIQRPPEWPVYVDGDPELDWLWPAKAVDIIQGLHAKVILLTPTPGRPPSR